jgi:chemotaxis protein methyltransferase CheR
MDEFAAFIHAFQRLSGIDLSLYKRPQLERRVRAFKDRHGFVDLIALARALHHDEELRARLLDKITINVSEFFRNRERWQALWPLVEAIPARPVRVWSAACATGEEAYTLAILFEQSRKPYNILATDVDERALQLAVEGLYRPQQLRELREVELNTYFEATDGLWRVRDELRRHIQFARHNLLDGRPPVAEPFHLIVCRNVLIYFTDQGKEKVISSLAQALMPGGLLFVGSTEQFLHSHRYGLVNIAPFVYQKPLD